MYRLAEIQNSLKNVVGWKQAYDPSKHIDTSLTSSESGLYFQGCHPLLTLDNIKSIMPDDFDFKYPNWHNGTSYLVGDKVKHMSKIWIALSDNINKEPDQNLTIWKEYIFLSDFLEQLELDGIASVVQNFIQMKQLDNETRNLMERRTFFDGSGRIKATIPNRSKICGYEIVPVRSMGVTTKIERIGLQMTGSTGVVTMYLFHSSQIDPIGTFELEFTQTNGGYQWFTMDNLYLPYISDDTNSGGSWFLCYNQDDLPYNMEAINISKDWSREPCGTCNQGDIETWRQLTKYLQISPFTYQAPSTFEEFPELWDIANTIYTNACNYGINVEVTVGCDLTDFIISQRHIFSTVIQKQVAANALRTLAMNPNANVERKQSNASKMDILYELDGNTQGERPGGLGYELKQAYNALKIDTQGLDRICLKCNNGGVRYRTA